MKFVLTKIGQWAVTNTGTVFQISKIEQLPMDIVYIDSNGNRFYSDDCTILTEDPILFNHDVPL